MASIEAILSGKTGNYFKLDDDELKDGFIIVEDIDPAKTDIRSEKIPNKNKKDGESDYLEYFHIGVRVGDVDKDLSLTFTALKQLAQALPHNENWKGYKVLYTGKKGSGKNVKYNFSVAGKQEVKDAPSFAASGQDDILKPIIDSLKHGSSFFAEGLIPMANVLQTAVTPANFQALKDKGIICEIKPGFFKVV